jgi:hypothetical protein
VPEVYLPLKGRGLERVRLSPSDMLGEGGEAEVYSLDSILRGKVFKLYKPPTHPDYAGSDEASKRNRHGAKVRLEEIQRKLRDFPKGLPSHVVSPLMLGYTSDGGTINGFAMDAVRGAVTFRDLCQATYRTGTGLDNNDMIQLFVDLYSLVSGLHQAGLVIGDFNYLNVLAKQLEAYCIDADSMQFGPYFCKSFTTRFVDPLICDPKHSSLVMNRPHSANTDWYAFATMLFEALTLVHPYAGVYRPKSGSAQIKYDARPLHRISIFHPEVLYPKKQLPLGHLPDEFLHFMMAMLEADKRGVFPLPILQNMRWTKCNNCGAEHGRDQCPACQHAARTMPRTFVRQGKVTVDRIFDSRGRILAAAHDVTLRYLYHSDGQFRREDGTVIMNGAVRPGMRFRISGAETLVSINDRTVLFSPSKEPVQLAVSSYRGRFPVFDANERFHYWLHNGALYRSGEEVPTFLGSVLPEQTLFWVGSKFGFGFYRAGNLQRGFVFDAVNPGINDQVEFPLLKGELLDATCFFTSRRCWFFAAVKQGAQTKIRCAVITPEGRVTATAEADEGDGSWLGGIRGKAAATLQNADHTVHALFAATANGLVRVDEDSGQLRVRAEFPDTTNFVEDEDRLFLDRSGMFVVGTSEIELLKLS